MEGLREKGAKGAKGLKPLMTTADTQAVKDAVTKHIESIKTAKSAWQKEPRQ